MSTRTVVADDSISTAVEAASICKDTELTLMAPVTCLTECPRGDKGVIGASTAPSATTTSVFSACVLHEGDSHLTAPGLQPRDKLGRSLPLRLATPRSLPVPC
jgi:hypothetical protein